MNLPKAFTWLELPLLKRELLENSHKKRTYVLRVLLALVLVLFMLVFYSEQVARRSSVLQVLGQGRILAGVLLIVDLFAVYILLPAMACSAISTEREKQTLSLILISRIGPGALIAEKFVSRLVPMLVLLLITAPMLGICYVLGGMTTEAMAMGLLIVLTAAIQVTSTAIFCSTVFRTTLEAFWATYAILALMALGPPLLAYFDLLPDIQLITGFPQQQQVVVFTLFLFCTESVIDGRVELASVAITTIPPLAVAAAMLVSSRFILAHFQESSPLNTRRLTRWARNAGSFLWNLIVHPFRRVFRFLRPVHSEAELPRSPRSLPIEQPIAWREINSTMLSGWRFQSAICAAIILIEFWILEENGTGHWSEELCVMVDMTVLVLMLLILIGLSCRTFASERERQTLDLLLTTPVDNKSLLFEKLAATNRALLRMLLAVLCAGVAHVMLGEFQMPARGPTGGYLSYGEQFVLGLSTEWWWGNFRFLFGLVSLSFVYMLIVKWTAVYFSLRLNSLMKSMLGTLISIVALCVVPFICCLLPLLLTQFQPERYPLVFFTTPIAVLIVNEYDDLQIFYVRSDWPASEYFILLFNLLLYGGLALILRAVVLRRLPHLLNRRD